MAWYDMKSLHSTNMAWYDMKSLHSTNMAWYDMKSLHRKTWHGRIHGMVRYEVIT